MQTSMKLYALWSALLAVALLAGAARLQGAWGESAGESLFVYALALWHGIYAIWFWKGAALAPFARASVMGRLLMALIYLSAAAHLRRFGATLPVAPGLLGFFIGYLLVQAAADLGGTLATWIGLRGQPAASDAGAGRRRIEENNRLLFAVYMIGVAAWVLLGTAGFLSFFHLPPTAFPAWRTGGQGVLLGPIHLLGVQILLLAYFNLVAVRYRLTPLIDAGVRGGLFTCVFFLALVAAGLLHPVILLLPMVDLLSVAWIFLSRRARPA
jgi:hypothetical protein